MNEFLSSFITACVCCVVTLMGIVLYVGGLATVATIIFAAMISKSALVLTLILLAVIIALT